MKLLAIEFYKDKFEGYIDDGDNYYRITGNKTETRKGSVYPKSKYRDYEHFAGVIGKFDPESSFYAEPREISGLGYDELRRVGLI